jgi:hypothetical protein
VKDSHPPTVTALDHAHDLIRPNPRLEVHMTTFHHSETQPDFADLYEPWIGRGGNITPRMAYYLWVSAQFLGDYWRLAATDPERVEELPVLA